MDRIDRDKALLLGLAALQDIADQAGEGPVASTIQLRALLALMATHATGA